MFNAFSVTQFSIARCILTDAEIESIAQIATLNNVFIAGGEGVTDAGIRPLKKLHSARLIHLIDFPDLTKGAIEELRRELPNCSVVWQARREWSR